MIHVSYDREHKTIVIEFEGNIDGAQARQSSLDLERVVPERRTEFRLLADLTAVQTMELEVEDELKKAMGLFNAHGITEVLRVLPDPDMEVGFNIMSRTYYGKAVKVLTFRSREEAEAHLRMETENKPV